MVLSKEEPFWVSLNETFIRNFSFLPFTAGLRNFCASMVQGRFKMAFWTRSSFQFPDRNNNGKRWVILQITQLEYLQSERFDVSVAKVRFQWEISFGLYTVGPIDGFQFEIVWL
jgi:hypothetical protein